MRRPVAIVVAEQKYKPQQRRQRKGVEKAIKESARLTWDRGTRLQQDVNNCEASWKADRVMKYTKTTWRRRGLEGDKIDGKGAARDENVRWIWEGQGEDVCDRYSMN